MATPKSDASSSVYRIKITLSDVEPPIWRRVEVEDCSLQMLHGVIQDAMGWENYHLYEFHIGDMAYTEPRAVDEDNRSAVDMNLSQVVGQKSMAFDYVYDLGDQWTHRIEIEAVGAPEPGVHYPRCVEGERRCPPEDCGGPARYGALLDAIKDPNHEAYDDFADLIPDDFNPETFDPSRVNRVWVSWDFSDPKSGPSYDQAGQTKPDAEERRTKTKAKTEPKSAAQSRIARNDPCPCGSGKKYKKCCMKKGKDGNFEDD
ncbi:MAG: SEC-C domain-containing protein [Pirellulales bacterium]|nr:SEC-C domain-containing protein [Pirellulales bacterium]